MNPKVKRFQLAEQALREVFEEQPATLDVWSRTELVVTNKEYFPMGSYSDK